MANSILAPSPVRDAIAEPKTGALTDVWRRWFDTLSIQFLYRWEDLACPANTLVLAGAASDPARSATTGLLTFSGVADNTLFGAVTMPYAWAPGSAIKPHIHVRFATSTATNSRWIFAYDRANRNGVFANAIGTYTTLSTITVANPQDTTKHVEANFGELAMDGFTEDSVLVWGLSRLAGSDAIDDYAGNCLLLEFGIYYQVSKFGGMVTP